MAVADRLRGSGRVYREAQARTESAHGEDLSMKLHPIISTKTGRKGYWIRHSDPDTGKRIVKTFWYADKRQAEKAVASYFDGVSARRDGLPDNSGWKMPY